MIRLQSVVQTFTGPRGAVQALRGVDLDVAAGEVFGVIGRSGAGKSTLVRSINLLSRPVAGRVWVDGEDLTILGEADLRRARRRIGMVFQHFNLLSSRTVFDNVALPLELAGMPRREIRQRVGPLLELVGLDALQARYPAQISGGQKQRVGIARALAHRPRVLLSDEATSALDPETTRSILALLQQIHRELGLTIVLITHQMQVIQQVARRVAVIDEGRIVEQGAVLQVFTQPVHPATRSLLEAVLPETLPEGVLQRLRSSLSAGAGRAAQAFRLHFAGEAAHRPWLSELTRRFGLDVTLVHGQIDDIQGATIGSLVVILRSSAGVIDDAAAYLRGESVAVHALAVGASSAAHDAGHGATHVERQPEAARERNHVA